jgi:hypothetical protein
MLQNSLSTRFYDKIKKKMKRGYFMGRKSKSGENTQKSPKSGRVFNVVQYEVNPITGVSLNFTEANILSCVAHKSISRYAYILHDNDHYSEIDCEEMLEKYQVTKTINDLKPRHWHIVLEVPNKCSVKLIAKWLNVPENQVEVPNDRGKTPVHAKGMNRVFLECVGYLTHSDIRQQALDKYIYDETLVKANFDWQAEVEAENVIRTKYGKPLTEKEWYRNEVLTNGLRPKDMMNNPLMVTAYTNDFMMLDKLRLKYLRMFAPMPPTRFNYYIYSDAGRVGKGILSRAFARSLFPNIDDDEDIYYSVSADKVAFDKYDGQPVIIWNDIRPATLLSIFGGRTGLLDVLDLHPVRREENVKYGGVCLVNTINIFNSILSYAEFFNELVGTYVDHNTGQVVRSEEKQREQIYGRFPMVIPVAVDDFSVLINKGIMGKGAFTEFYEHKKVVSHLKKVHESLSAREDLVRQIDSRTVQPLVEAHNIVSSQSTCRNDYSDMTDDDILAQFADSGTVIDGDTLEEHNKQRYEDYLHKCYDDYNNTFKNGYCGQSYDDWLNDSWSAPMRLSYEDFLIAHPV